MGINLAWIAVSLILVVKSGVFCKTIRSKTLHHLMTKRELQKCFGVDSHDQVPEYDVTHPYRSSHEGEFITYDLRSKHRTRRAAKTDDTHHYSLNTFGKTLHLNLRENKNLIKPGLQVETHAEGKVKKTRLRPSTHYLGEVRDHPGSSVAITNHGALSGMIKLRDDALFLRPLPRRISRKVQRNKRSTAHIIYRYDPATVLDDSPISMRDEVLTDLKGLQKRVVLTKRVNYENDSASNNTERYLELGMVADEQVKALHGNNDSYTADYLLTIGNIMNGIFHYDSFGAQKVAIVINRLFIITNEALGATSNSSSSTKIHALINWTNHQFPAPAAPPIDAISLVHRGGDLLGLGLLSGLCVVRIAPSTSGDVGLQTAFKLSHEIGHNMGLGHDGENMCPPGNIMSPTVIGGPEMFKWSNCSKTIIQEYLSGPMSYCLKDEPPSDRPTLSASIANKLPGEVNDGDIQCKYQYGSNWRRCPQEFSNCKSLFCTRDYVYCHSHNAPPLSGTTCGVRNLCVKGECVDNGSPFINGAWSAWSATYTECTQTCGGGVQHRTRTCSNPPPGNGGDPCEGNSDGHWRICNPEPCPANTPSFRGIQCTAKNSETSPYLPSASCDLRCIKGSLLYSYGKVADGTRCSPDKKVLDVCIEGTCKVVGCDHVLGSSARYDRCDVCNGDGSSCALDTGVYTTEHRGWGVDNADTIKTLPPGTTKAHFEKRAATYNVLGIQNGAGSYLITLPTWSTTIKAAGCTIVYKHESNLYKDTLDIDGPTTETLLVKYVYFYGSNGGIDYKYYAPSNESQPTTFSWNTSEWSSCSHTCAGGYQTRWVYCLRADDNTYASESSCDSATKPHMGQLCNTQACPAEWHLTHWQECSKSCGNGTQSRRLYCRKQINSTNHEEIPDSSCPPASKPNVTVFSRNCRQIACPPDWQALDWSTCSTTCSPGVTTRNLVCRRVAADGVEETVTSSMCEVMPKPITSQPCNADIPCGPPEKIKIACFRANPVPLEQTLEDLSGSVNWDNTEPTVETCQELAHEAGFKYFALANNGICYSGPNTKTNYYEQGPASLEDCNNGIGRQGFMFVYSMDPMPPLTNLGCFLDKGYDRALPLMIANMRPQIKWTNMNLTISQCGHIARDKGYSYFGVQYYGECWSGPDNDASEDYDKHGSASNCVLGVGANWSSMVYKMAKDKPRFETIIAQLPPLRGLGCFNDHIPAAPVLPTLYANFRSQIYWYNMNLTISQCAHVARDLGRSYFGIRFYGECYTAPDEQAAEDYSKQGEASTCWSGVGSNYASYFYTFNNA